MYNRLIVTTLLNFGYLVSFKTLDRGFIEFIGPFGIPKLIYKQSQIFGLLQSGQITHYLFFMILGLCFFFVITIFSFFSFSFILDYRLIALFFTLVAFV